MVASLSNKVALVTGSSRGIGRGIALQLGAAGAKVYVTGRRPENHEAALKDIQPNGLETVAQEITKRGGKGVAIFCDHSNPDDVKKLFERINKENNGQLDILVNNAYAGVNYILNNTRQKFYDLDPVESYDSANNVGLRNHYICSTYAARLMVPRKSGLIVTVSSSGGMAYLFNTAYGIGKSGCDRLAADIAVDLAEANITSVSLWPGPVKTEIIHNRIIDSAEPNPIKGIFDSGETIEYSGQCVVALATDSKAVEYNGQILTTADIGRKYNLFDEGKTQPKEMAPRFREFINCLNKIRNPADYRENAKI
jgi:dehydrogenase/reductase SDR family protein 1